MGNHKKRKARSQGEAPQRRSRASGARSPTAIATARKRRILAIRAANTAITRFSGRGRNRVVLVLDHQGFTIEPECSLADCEWIRTQLAIALNRFKNGD